MLHIKALLDYLKPTELTPIPPTTPPAATIANAKETPGTRPRPASTATSTPRARWAGTRHVPIPCHANPTVTVIITIGIIQPSRKTRLGARFPEAQAVSECA